jgi:Predicted signal transduction protein with a C-terminal ATPase domain
MDKEKLGGIVKKLRGSMTEGGGRLKAFYKDLPIRIKLMVVLNIVILIPLIVISFFSYKSSEDILTNKSIKYSQDILKIIDLRVGDSITSLNSLAIELLDDATVNNYIQNDRFRKDTVQVYHDEDDVRDLLKDEIRIKGEIQGVSISVGNTLHCYADDSTKKVSIEDVIPYGGKLYKKVLKLSNGSEGSPVWYIDNSGGNTYILYARAIVDRNTFENSGMMVFLVKPEWFSTVFNGLGNEDMKRTAVLSQKKQVVLSQYQAQNYKLSDKTFRAMSYDTGWVADNAQNTLISYVTVDGTGWKIASYIPLSVLYRDIEYLKQKIIIALICAVFFLLLVSFYLSYDFVAAIYTLVEGMKKLQGGDESVEVKLKRRDELGFMGSAFNTMAREITTLQKWVLREQLTRKDAQIKALQSQINPHFLFNTLESINWMAQLSHVPEISETVTALASLMEASIARSNKCITLAEEIAYIDNYIFILKKRFEGRLELIKEIDGPALEVRVPRLLIQPIVENAANHGVANIRGKGIVRLSATVDGEMIRIAVEDNGAGIDEDELEILNDRLSMNDENYVEAEEGQQRNGIGLENVNRRIKLFYGPQFGIKIESQKGVYTRVCFDIPREANEKTHD